MSKKIKITIVIIISIITTSTIVLAQNSSTKKGALILPTPTIIPLIISPTPTPYQIRIIPTIKTYPTSTPAPSNSSLFTSPTLTTIPVHLSSSSTSSIDTTPPTLSFALGFTSSDNRGSQCLPLRGDDNVSVGTQQFMFRQSIDDGAWTEWRDELDGYFPCFDYLSNGPHTLSFQVKDQAGNISNTLSKNFYKGTPTGSPIPMNNQ